MLEALWSFIEAFWVLWPSQLQQELDIGVLLKLYLESIREQKCSVSAQAVSYWCTHRGVGHCSFWVAHWVPAAPQPGSQLCLGTGQTERTHRLCSTCSALPSALLWAPAPSSQIKVIPLPLYYFSLWLLCDNTMYLISKVYLLVPLKHLSPWCDASALDTEKNNYSKTAYGQLIMMANILINATIFIVTFEINVYLLTFP